MDFFKKYDKNEFSDLLWNVPERKTGTMNVIGGNSQSFRTVAKVTEYLSANFPLEHINTVLPDALKVKLPTVEGLLFLSSTESGSFADADELLTLMNNADASLLAGDLSRNNITKDAVVVACEKSERLTLATRDTVGLLVGSEKVLMREEMILFSSLAQLQKVLREVYYPRVLTLSQPFMQVVETLHKFTLSYPVKIVTFHAGQILISENGEVAGVPLDKTKYTVITMWMGEFAARMLAINLYNPDNFLKATVAAMF